MLYCNTNIVMLIYYTSITKNIWCRATNTKEKQEEKRNKMKMENFIQQKNQLWNYFGWGYYKSHKLDLLL